MTVTMPASTSVARRPAASPSPGETVGSYQVTAPRGGQTWCQSNTGLFLTILGESPNQDDPAAVASHREAVTVARRMCETMCPRFETCRTDAILGPPVDGFVAGLTESERRRHRKHMGLAARPEVVTDRYLGLDCSRSRSKTDTEALDAVLRSSPDLSSTELAERLGVSPSTVKRRKRYLAQVEAAGQDCAADLARQEAQAKEKVKAYYAAKAR